MSLGPPQLADSPENLKKTYPNKGEIQSNSTDDDLNQALFMPGISKADKHKLSSGSIGRKVKKSKKLKSLRINKKSYVSHAKGWRFNKSNRMTRSGVDSRLLEGAPDSKKLANNRDVYTKMKKLLISQYTPKEQRSNKRLKKHRRLRSAFYGSQRSNSSKSSNTKLNSFIERPASNRNSNSNLKESSLHSILKHLGGSYTD